MKSKVTVPVMKDPLPQRQKTPRKHTCLVGWIRAGKQIKTPRGGGTRKLNLPKSCKKGEILEEIKPPFFPEGKSPMGPIEDFDFSVADFSEHIGTKDSGGCSGMPCLNFGNVFYIKNTKGADVKILTTVHIIKQEEWEAVAKTLVLCFKQEKYLPEKNFPDLSRKVYF